MAKANKSAATDPILKQLREFGLKYPGAHFKSPWPGHMDLAVNDKTFAYLSIEGEPFGISCKLPRSAQMALMMANTEPTPYGLGKSGWVSAKFPDGKIPVEVLKAWIDESYRAQAPKKLLKQLDAGGAAVVQARGASSPTAPARRGRGSRAPARRAARGSSR